MTNLINRLDSISYLNYINPATFRYGETVGLSSSFQSLLVSAWGPVGTYWNGSSYYTLRPPAPGIETISGSVGSGTYVSRAENTRLYFSIQGSDKIHAANSTNTTTNDIVWLGAGSGTISIPSANYFGVCDDYSISFVQFNTTLSSVSRIVSMGWLDNMQYSSAGGFPKNLYIFDTALASRPYRLDVINTEKRSVNFINWVACSSTPSIINPTINCSIATPGADAFQVLFRDANSPNNYIGNIRNFIQTTQSISVGKVVRNSGLDPNSSSNTSWLSVGSWGANSLLMRVWTENVV